VVSQAEFVLNQVVEAMPGAEGSIMCGGNIRGYQNYTCNQVRKLDRPLPWCVVVSDVFYLL
jgi:hypothetical protein